MARYAVRIETEVARQIVTRLSRLRGELSSNCLDKCKDGWTIATFDPNRLLAICEHIRLKPGMKLIAYQYRAGDNGNGQVFAVPAECPVPSPEDFGDGLEIRGNLPGWADPQVGRHLVLDGSPEAYFEASVLTRELRELGAAWHGCSWSTYAIVFSLADVAGLVDSELKWRKRPDDFRPQVTGKPGAPTITFWAYTGLGEERVIRLQDQFKDGCTFSTKAATLATGDGGFIF